MSEEEAASGLARWRSQRPTVPSVSAGADANAKPGRQGGRPNSRGHRGHGLARGVVLGSEADLLERCQVSRTVFREAIRLLEHQQVAHTRRGPGGGLVVAEPTIVPSSTRSSSIVRRVDADSTRSWRPASFWRSSRPARIRTDRRSGVVRLSSSSPAGTGRPRARPAGACRARGCRQSRRGLALFIDVFNQVAQLYSPDWQRLGSNVEKEAVHAHAMIAEAVMAGDGGLARNRMRKHLQAEAEFFRRRRSTRQLLPDSVVLADSGLGKGAGRSPTTSPDHRGRGSAAGGPGGDRARADRP